MYSHNDWALGKSLTVKEMDGWCLSPFHTRQGSQSSHSVWSQGSDILKYPDETTRVKAGSQKGCPEMGIPALISTATLPAQQWYSFR